jgi:hypothetical protein
VRREDIVDFDLGEEFDAAVCPISSLAHLGARGQMERHLECMALHLVPGARYMVMLDLRSRAGCGDPDPACGRWEVGDPRGGAVIECR